MNSSVSFPCFDDKVRYILKTTRTIALVGASNKPDRASYEVMEMLQKHGYTVYPVNPVLAGQRILNETVVSSLKEINAPIDMVDIFRNADSVPPVVDEAIAVNAKVVWMQLGVINDAAARTAEKAGLLVVMDHCPKLEIARLGLLPHHQTSL